ncbi:uncharacterized protein LOC125145267 isoform X1 [Tachysurus ichikawai]
MSQKITKFCDEIKFGNKFNYTSGHPYSTDCEPTWYAQYEYVFQVTNRTTSIGETEPTKTDDHRYNYLWLLVLLVPLVALIMCLVWHKRKRDYSLKPDVENAAKEEVQALNGHANGSSKRDGGNVDHPNGNAQSIPMNSIKPQNEEEDEAPNGHALTAHG